MDKVALSLSALLMCVSANVSATHGPRIQFIHSSTAAAVGEVDVWYNPSLLDGQYPPVKLFEGFSYKHATPYQTFALIYGDPVIYLTEAGAADASDPLFVKTLTGLEYETSYVVVAAGDPGGDFDLFVTSGEEVARSSHVVAVKVFHASAGTSAVDISEGSAGLLVDNLAFSQAQGYLDLSPAGYRLQVASTGGTWTREFDVPLASFGGLGLVVAATGNLETTGAADDSPFSLLTVTPAGDVVEILPNEIFENGFETGSTSGWSAAIEGSSRLRRDRR